MNFDSLVDTLQVTDKWLQASHEERLRTLSEAIDGFEHSYDIEVVSAPDSGQVVLRMTSGIEPSVRGVFLLSLEAFIKREVDEGVTIWLEPVGDKSKLRKLRGVIVKESSEI